MLELTVLGSGSAGNCSALTIGGGRTARLVLVDAGLSPRETAARLERTLGRRPDEATDLVLTHLDGDHWRPTWRRVLERHPIRVRLHAAHVRRAIELGVPEQAIVPLSTECDAGAGLRIEAVRVPHDSAGSTAYLLEWSDGCSVARIGFATDLGRVPSALFERFRDLDVLALESNYDDALQQASPRPARLKARIRGGRGHLSNDASVAAARRIGRASDLKAIVLLHLSRECNRPELVAALWQREAPEVVTRLVFSEQHRPAPTVHAAPRARRLQEEEATLFAMLW